MKTANKTKKKQTGHVFSIVVLKSLFLHDISISVHVFTKIFSSNKCIGFGMS